MNTRAFLSSLIIVSAAQTLGRVTPTFAPSSWAPLSVALWTLYAVTRGFRSLSTWDKRQAAWGIVSAFCFAKFLQYDPTFTVRDRSLPVRLICCFSCILLLRQALQAVELAVLPQAKHFPCALLQSQ